MTRAIAIIGAGIGGTAAALCFARTGHAVTLYEQAAEIAEVGAGLQIGPNGMAVLAAVGLDRQVLAHAARPDRLVIADGPSGRPLAELPFGRQMEARYGAAYVQMHRADLLALLLDAARTAGAQVVLGARRQAQDLAEADLVVAADGLRSAHRAGLNPGTAPAFTGHVAWRALIPAARLSEPIPTETRLFIGPGRHMVLYPLRNGQLLNLVAVQAQPAEVPEGWKEAGDPAQVSRAFAGWCDAVQEPLATLQEVHRWGLFGHAPLAHWTDGWRLALLGDACHPMLPYFAQGAVMALEDAWMLAAEVGPGSDIPAALARYQARRQARTARVQRAAAANGRLYHAAAGPRRAVMRGGMRLLSALPGTPLLRKFDWIYGGDVTRGQ